MSPTLAFLLPIKNLNHFRMIIFMWNTSSDTSWSVHLQVKPNIQFQGTDQFGILVI